MKPNNSIIHGLMAKTASGRACFSRGLQEVLPQTFPPASPLWFCVDSVGLAMHAPAVNQCLGGEMASLALVGTTYGADQMTRHSADADVGALRDFQRYGSGALEKLTGEFAVAFWDGNRQQLILARDHFGQRDLFVREDKDFYIFCSELAPLLSDPFFDCQLDFESAVHYLTFGLPVPGRTLARRVTRVPAAHFLTWRADGALMAQRYYTPIRHDAQKVLDQQGRLHIAATLDRAIERRIAPGRQAILLSGGVDSSYIAMTAAMRAGGDCFDAYTIEFSAPFRHNESEFARIVAQKSGMRHYAVELPTSQALASLETVLEQAEPCSAWASITHHHLVSQIRADGHGHLLSGLGADEVFGGYWKYFQAYARLRRHDASWPNSEQVDSIDGLMWLPTLARSRLFAGIPRFFTDKALRGGLSPFYRNWNHTAHPVSFYRECRSHKNDAHLFELMVAHECQHRIPDLLFASFETIGRSLGMRAAYPFLAPDVAALACGLGASERFWRHDNRWRNKKALREIAATRVPPVIMQRPLYSYTAPILMWMGDPQFASVIMARLQNSRLWETGLVTSEWLKTIMHEVNAQIQNPKLSKLKFTYVEQMWVLITLAGWYDQWVKRNK